MNTKMLEPDLYKKPPSVCPRPGCGGTVYIPHEEGWQCLNCMKIIYRANHNSWDKFIYKRYCRE